MATKKTTVATKATATNVTATKTALEKKNDAIVSAQALAVAAAIKTEDDAAQFLKNPASFAKKNGITLTTSFANDIKESVANASLTPSLRGQLSASAISKVEGLIRDYFVDGDGPILKCGPVKIVRKLVDPVPVKYVRKLEPIPVKVLRKIDPIPVKVVRKLDVKILKCGPVKLIK